MRRASSEQTQRLLGFAIVAATLLAAFGLAGGIGSAGSPANAAQYQYGKVTVCHVAGLGNEVTITVAASAVPAHLRHGDAIGPCAGDS